MKTKCFCLSALFLLGLAGTCIAQSAGPSLGEVARKARAEKKAVMVFSDDNMTRSVPAADHIAPLSSSGTPVSQSIVSGPDAAKESKRQHATKAAPESLDAKVAELQKKLSSMKQEQSVWSNSEKQYEDKLSAETDDFRRNTYQEALDNDRENAELYKSKIDQIQADLAKAEEAAAAAKQKTQDHADAFPGNSQ